MGLTELDLKATPLVFRDAVMADIPAVVALVESAYRGDSGRRGWTTESDLLEGQRVDAAGVADVDEEEGARVDPFDSRDRALESHLAIGVVHGGSLR